MYGSFNDKWFQLNVTLCDLRGASSSVPMRKNYLPVDARELVKTIYDQ